MLLTRRSFLLAVGVGVAAGGLAGCSVFDPTIVGTPATPSVDQALRDAVKQAIDDETAAWAALLGYAQTVGDADGRFATMAATVAHHVAILSSAFPLNRDSAATPPAPPAPATYADEQEATDGFSLALNSLRNSHHGRAVASTGVTAAYWGSLAASARQLRAGLLSPYPAPGPINPGVRVAELPEADALSALLAAYQEAIFVARACLGFVAADDPDAKVMQEIVTGWKKERDSLADFTLAAGATPPPAKAAYALEQTGTKEAAVTLLTRVQRTLCTNAAAWAAATTDQQDRACAELETAAIATIDLGIGTAFWPGWPD